MQGTSRRFGPLSHTFLINRRDLQRYRKAAQEDPLLVATRRRVRLTCHELSRQNRRHLESRSRPDGMTAETSHCSIHDSCGRPVPVWLVLLDNVPTLILFVLGAVLVGHVSRLAAAVMTIYNLASIVMFWRCICCHCPHFGTRACPCGYGIIAAGLFERKEGGDFRRIFRKNILVVFPAWFVPLGAGTYLLHARFSREALITFVAFVLVGFVLIPLISRFVGCKGCELKQQCPWMTSRSR